MKRFVLIPLLFLAGVVGAETVKSVATTPVERPEERNQQRHAKFNEVSKEGTA